MSTIDRQLGSPAPAPEPEPLLDPYAHPLPPERRRGRVTLVIAIIALLTATASASLLGWGAYRWHQMAIQMAVDDDGEGDSITKRAALEAEDEEQEEADDARDDAADEALKSTVTTHEGGIEVVDLGVKGESLRDTLRLQVLFAKAKDQRLLVMLTGRRCAPCRGVDASLSHPLMQEALRGVRLVRIDLDAFGDELRQLDIPTGLYPAFFLLGEDLRPVDAIHGGEWDEDVAENIAPVLGAFVAGQYRERRHQDWSPTTSSIRI